MIWVLVPLAAIISWAIVESAKYRAQSGGGPELQRLVEELGFQLDEAEEERERLRERVQNLEAIVTGESYELDRAAQKALGEAEPRLSLDLGESESDELEVARRAQRMRDR